jgi:arylsulfatase A-like enzyme
MLRTQDWNLVRHYQANELDELYDLKNDPGETKNLYRDQKVRAVRDQLQKRLEVNMRKIDDPLLRAVTQERR